MSRAVIALDGEFTGRFGYRDALDMPTAMPWFGAALVVDDGAGDAAIAATYEGHVRWRNWAFEPGTLAWWETMPDKLARLQAGTMAEDDAVNGLVEFIRRARAAHPGVRTVVDSPTDITWFNDALARVAHTDLANLDGAFTNEPDQMDLYFEGAFGFAPGACPSINAELRRRCGGVCVNGNPHHPVDDAVEYGVLVWRGRFRAPK
jgi:hypothetical protein